MKNFKPFLILLPLFAFIFLACGLFEKKEDVSVKDPEQLEQGEKITLVGRISFYMDGDYYFNLQDGEQDYTVFISTDQSLNIGDYVEVKGIWEKEINGLSSESIRILSEDEKIAYFESRFPFLKIEILESPKTIAHTCATPKFKFKLTNTGTDTVTYKDLHKEEYNYAFYYFVNENFSRANADREDYLETEKEQSILVSNQGFIHFEDIAPGQSREVEYWAGGIVNKHEGGTAGSSNIFGNYPVGEHEFFFAWADKNNYDPIFLYKTEPVKVTLLTDKCDLGL